MHRFAMKLGFEGQVTLPAEYRRAVDAWAGDRLTLLVDDEGRGTLTKLEDDLMRSQEIARRARAEAGPPSTSNDPIGDDLVEEDDRTKSDR